MAWKNFSEKLWVKVQETGTINGLGKITSTDNYTLEHIRIVLYSHGIAAGSETLQLKLYTDVDHTIEYAASNVVTLSDIPNFGTNWLGLLRFDFATKPNMNAKPKYAALTAGSYTRVADTFYLSSVLEWPLDVNSVIKGNRGAWLEMYGNFNRGAQ